jgi:hypothetical protein
MPRNIFTVVIDRMISAARVKVRNEDDSITWEVDASTGYGSVAVKDMKPDGTNRLPAMDAASRAGYQVITDGTNTMPAGDAPARALYAKWVPERPASDLDASIIIFNHGTVTANWSTNTAAAVAQSADRDLWITDVSLVPTSDPTSEIQTQHIPFQLFVEDTTDSQYRQILLGGIPGNTHFIFNTPLKISRSHNWRTGVKLGGAANLNIYAVINGFEEA